MPLRRPGDRRDPRLLREQPGERDLRRRGVLLLGEPLQPLDECLVRLAVLLGETWDDVAEVGRIKRRLVIDRPGEKPLAERAEWDQADAQFRQQGQNLVLRLAPTQRVLALQGRDWLNRMCTADGL